MLIWLLCAAYNHVVWLLLCIFDAILMSEIEVTDLLKSWVGLQKLNTSKGIMSYILGVKWSSSCSKLGDHTKYTKNRARSPHFMVLIWTKLYWVLDSSWNQIYWGEVGHLILRVKKKHLRMLSSKLVYKMKFTFLLHTCFTIKSCLGSVTLSTHTGHTLNAYVTNQPTPLSSVFSQKTTANIAGCLVFITIIPITGITFAFLFLNLLLAINFTLIL